MDQRSAGDGRLPAGVSDELDRLLAPVDSALAAIYPGQPRRRQPVHTVYVPADRVVPGLATVWGREARQALSAHPPAPFDPDLLPRVYAKLDREPIEDLRVDFEDGFGVRTDDEEDAAVDRSVAALVAGPLPPFVGLRCKSQRARCGRPPNRRRARPGAEHSGGWCHGASEENPPGDPHGLERTSTASPPMPDARLPGPTRSRRPPSRRPTR